MEYLFENLGNFRGKITLLGIGPMSRAVIKASLELARDYSFPVFFIASRNQIDMDEFGGGYVLNLNQGEFAELIKTMSNEVKFTGKVYLCRDHGGPWQRDEEKEAKLPEKEAMEIAKKSYLEDLNAGFNLFHIDPTKDPHYASGLPLEENVRMTLELMKYIEEERIKRNLRRAYYEVGTEDIQGGHTSLEDFEKYIILLLKALRAHKLPKPVFVVGQTGTLVKMKSNVGKFDKGNTKILAQIAAKYDLGFKEHNCDYVSEEILKEHPELEITMANVAPEFAVTETEAYIKLWKLEEEALREEAIKYPSTFYPALTELVLSSNRWQKWWFKDRPIPSISEIREDALLMEDIVKMSGHYFYQEGKFKEIKQRLFENLRNYKLKKNPEAFVIDSIKKSILRYVKCFGLQDYDRRKSYAY